MPDNVVIYTDEEAHMLLAGGIIKHALTALSLHAAPFKRRTWSDLFEMFHAVFCDVGCECKSVVGVVVEFTVAATESDSSEAITTGDETAKKKKPKTAGEYQRQIEARDAGRALAWLFYSDRDPEPPSHGLTFLEICAGLDLNPVWIRQQARNEFDDRQWGALLKAFDGYVRAKDRRCERGCGDEDGESSGDSNDGLSESVDNVPVRYRQMMLFD